MDVRKGKPFWTTSFPAPISVVATFYTHSLVTRRGSAGQVCDRTVFDADKPAPLAIGVHEQLTELGLSAKETGDLLRWWTRRHQYYAALARGGSRYNLDASVAGPVSTEDQAHAGRKASEPRHIGRRKGAVAR
jgi:hypothetical protein